MTDNEILREYKTAKHPYKQIQILADLNPSLGRRGIYDALIRAGENIKIPRNLLTEEERMQEELSATKVDGRSKPWSDERRAKAGERVREAAQRRREAKEREVQEKEVQEWKPIKFDEETKRADMPTSLQYVIAAGMQATLKEAKDSLNNARILEGVYNDSVDWLNEHGYAGRFNKIEEAQSNE